MFTTILYKIIDIKSVELHLCNKLGAEFFAFGLCWEIVAVALAAAVDEFKAFCPSLVVVVTSICGKAVTALQRFVADEI